MKIDFKADDRDAFVKWVRSSSHGETCLYHVGLLMADRQRAEKGLEKLREMARIKDIAVETAAFADQGFVKLVQHRLGDGQYEYIAVRTKKGAAPLSKPVLQEAA